MRYSKIVGLGHHVPETVITNAQLSTMMDTTDEWIIERTGIKERHYAHRTEETTTTMGVEAAKIAIERAGITKDDVDFIIFATLSPDYYFPGCGVLLQRELKITKNKKNLKLSSEECREIFLYLKHIIKFGGENDKRAI